MNQPSFQELPASLPDQTEPSIYRTPLPSSFQQAPRSASPASPITPVICDERAISKLLESLLDQAGLTPKAAAALLGYKSANSVRQYLAGRRTRPSLLWFIKFCNLCGAEVSISFPRR